MVLYAAMPISSTDDSAPRRKWRFQFSAQPFSTVFSKM